MMIGIPEKYQLSPEQETYLIKTREILERHSSTVVAKWKWLIQYFSRPEIQALRQPESLTYYLDFWYGPDGHALISGVFYLNELPFDHPEGKDNFDVYSAQSEIEEELGPDYKVPAGDALAYREMRSNRFMYDQTEATFFQWYAELWQGNQLFKHSFYAFTVQNNSIMMFDLNRCCWEEFFFTDFKQLQHTSSTSFSQSFHSRGNSRQNFVKIHQPQCNLLEAHQIRGQ